MRKISCERSLSYIGSGRRSSVAGPDPRIKRITDAGQMKAIAHPLRLQLLGSLRIDGPATATTLARAFDVETSLASYHLRQLETHGFVEEAPDLARDGRERWWRSSHDRTQWDTSDFLDEPERRVAAAAFRREILRVYAERLDEYVAV